MKNNLRIRVTGLFLLIVFLINIFILPSLAAETGVINPDGTINKDVFDRDWQKYSDLDPRIPF
ncbi:MAG: hypothetical protein ACYDEJ_13070 [Desulfitobacteriaceae bacterium]